MFRAVYILTVIMTAAPREIMFCEASGKGFTEISNEDSLVVNILSTFQVNQDLIALWERIHNIL